MKFLEQLIKKESTFQRIVGLNISQFNLLAHSLEPFWKEAEGKRLQRENRIRKIGGGHPYKLQTIKNKVVAVLIYYKQYPTQEFLGLLFEIDQSTVSRMLKKMLPLIEDVADPQLKIYLTQAKEDCRKRISSWDELLQAHPDLKDVSTDATEQQCYRATKYAQQKKYYSGKTKQHAIKTQIAVSVSGRILDISKSFPGAVHDKAMIDEEKTIDKFDRRVPLRFDLGYQGVKNKHPDHYIVLPAKKPKGGALSKLDKELNRANSKRRVIAEHAFARMKKFRICSALFRQPLDSHCQTLRNIVSILNFRLANPVLA